MVTFALSNLAEDVYPRLLFERDGYHFCRNVLMCCAGCVRGSSTKFPPLAGGRGAGSSSAPRNLFPAFSQFARSISTGRCSAGVGGVARAGDLFPKETVHRRIAVIFFPELGTAEGGTRRDSHRSAEEEDGGQPAAVKPTIYEEAMTLFQQGNYPEAAQKLKMDPGDETMAESSALMARICANLGQLAEAQMWAEKAIAADKLNPAGLHYLRAVIYWEQDALEEVHRLLETGAVSDGLRAGQCGRSRARQAPAGKPRGGRARLPVESPRS